VCFFHYQENSPPGETSHGQLPAGGNFAGTTGQFPGCRSSFRRMFPLASWLGNLCFMRRIALETLDFQMQASLPSGAFSGRKLPSSESFVSLLQNAAGRCRDLSVVLPMGLKHMEKQKTKNKNLFAMRAYWCLKSVCCFGQPRCVHYFEQLNCADFGPKYLSRVACRIVAKNNKCTKPEKQQQAQAPEQ
jgi:hypothetical protein